MGASFKFSGSEIGKRSNSFSLLCFISTEEQVYFCTHSTAPLAFLDVRATRPCRTIFNNCGFMVITSSHISFFTLSLQL